MKTRIWMVHDGSIECIMGVFYSEQSANTLCDDLNSSTNDERTYFVDGITIEDSE